MMKSLLAALIVLLCVKVKAGTDDYFDNYYTVGETPRTAIHEPSLDPIETLQEILDENNDPFAEIRTAVVSLFNFEHHQNPYGDLTQPYNRLKQFGGWIRRDETGGCLNTRAQVLVRDSQEPVVFNTRGCVVVSGRWVDPYSSQTIRTASDLDIDHFVPLKNAYLSGAHKWDFKRRCLYANYRGNNFHLLAVSNSENRRKGDRSPADYIPQPTTYRCQYLSQWLKVKLIWKLELSPPEHQALLELAQENHCPTALFEFRVQELAQQRQVIAQQAHLCQ